MVLLSKQYICNLCDGTGSRKWGPGSCYWCNGKGYELKESEERSTVTKAPRKELWQMTRAEYESVHGQLRENTTVTGRFSPHQSAIEVALNRGLPVPKEVLDGYPGLINE